MKLTVLLLATPVVWALQYCPPPGPVLPPPKIKISHPKGIWHAPEFRNLPFNEDSSYVIKASIGDTNVLSHSWIAPSQSLADPNADPANIKSRVASITKLFTVLAVLLSKDQIPWESSIRDYIPELQGKIWDEVTISALAGHTAGLGRFVCLPAQEK